MPATIPPRPRSEAQRAASRANGARSRGPRTAEGKARSARNAFRHGLCSPAILAPGEDPAAFERLLAELRAEYRPASPSEVLLVERLAIAFWKLARCDRLEARLATIEPHCPPGRLWPDPGLPRLLSRVPELATLLRHQAQLGREVHRLTRLLATRAAAPDAPDPDPVDYARPEASASGVSPGLDPGIQSAPSSSSGADPRIQSSWMAGSPAGHADGESLGFSRSITPGSFSCVTVGPRPDHPVPFPSSSGSDPRIQPSWMAGSPAGHDTKGDGTLAHAPVMVGPRADHPVPFPSSSGSDPRIQPSWMAGSPAGHDAKGDGVLTASPVMVGRRADHPASSPPSSSPPAPHEILRNEPEPASSNAARSGTAPRAVPAVTERHAGLSTADRTEQTRGEGLPRSAPNVFLARDHRPDRERA